MNTYKLKELGGHEAFDPSMISKNVPFTQAIFYGEWQKSLGRKVRRYLVSDLQGSVAAYFQLIQYPLIRGKSYWYAPYGPVVSDSLASGISKDFLGFLKKELTTIAQDTDAVFVRFDFTPSDMKQAVFSEVFAEAPSYTYHSAYFQPRFEWFLGLDKPEDELLKEMHEKTRYSVRLATRKEITAEIVTEHFDAYFDVFYTLMKDTADRNGFSLHEKKYYEIIFKSLAAIPGSYLAVARYKETVLAVDLVIVFSGIANYVFGGSSSEERNRMPTYLAQWAAMTHAKKIGCRFYNFGAVSGEGDSYTGWDGITSFKKKFGGIEIKHSDFFDLIVSPFWYHLYNLRKRFQRLIGR